MNIEEFRKICRREVNKTIARKLGYICNDNWEFNQNAMRGGSGTRAYPNLTLLKHKGDVNFSHIGWNPFDCGSNALGLLISFGIQVDLKEKTHAEAKEFIVYLAYVESIK